MGLRCLFGHKWAAHSFYKGKMIMVMCSRCPKILITVFRDESFKISWLWGLPVSIKHDIEDHECPVYMDYEEGLNELSEMWKSENKDR